METGRTLPDGVNVTIHCADRGPSLEACMISLLQARLSAGRDFQTSAPCDIQFPGGEERL